MIPSDIRKKYDYDLIKNLYIEHNHINIDDSNTLNKLREKFKNVNVLLILPGSSIVSYKQQIIDIIDDNTIVIPVNFIFDEISIKEQLPFFGSEKRYLKFNNSSEKKSFIVVSNISNPSEKDYVVNYESLIDRENNYFDVSVIMCLNLLLKFDINKIFFAGFDGFVTNQINYYDQELFEDGRFKDNYEQVTKNVFLMFKKFVKKFHNKDKIKFITPSIYESVLTS